MKWIPYRNCHDDLSLVNSHWVEMVKMCKEYEKDTYKVYFVHHRGSIFDMKVGLTKEQAESCLADILRDSWV